MHAYNFRSALEQRGFSGAERKLVNAVPICARLKNAMGTLILLFLSTTMTRYSKSLQEVHQKVCV